MAHQWRCDLVGDATAEVEVPRRSAVENWQGRQQVDADRDRPPSLGSPRESSSREQIGDRVCLSMGAADDVVQNHGILFGGSILWVRVVRHWFGSARLSRTNEVHVARGWIVLR
jgi:hypothetical protein